MTVAITTIDNPFNPINEFDEWFNFDSIQKGYNTCQYLARIMKDSDQLSENEQKDEIERAIDEIVEFGIAFDRNGNISKYKKVVEN